MKRKGKSIPNELGSLGDNWYEWKDGARGGKRYLWNGSPQHIIGTDSYTGTCQGRRRISTELYPI